MFIRHYNGCPNQQSKTRKQNCIRTENKLCDDMVIYTESPTDYTEELLGIEFCLAPLQKRSFCVQAIEKLSQLDDIIHNRQQHVYD